MKKNLLIMITIFSVIFIMVGCGTSSSNQDATQASEGNMGTGEQLPTKQDLDDGKTKDITPLLESMEYSVDVETSNDQATFHMNLKNTTDEAVQFGFSSGQQFEIVVRDKATQQEVYRYSEGMMFTEAFVFVDMQPNDVKKWSFNWDYKGREGEKVGAGDYVATLTLLPSQLNEQGIDANPFVKDAEFSIPETEGDAQTSENTAFRQVEASGSNGHYVVTGEARVFEGAFSYYVEDGHNLLTDHLIKYVDAGAPTWSDFTIEINLEKEKLPTNGVLTLVLFEASPKDGKPTNEKKVLLEQFK
ncbi:hypothetical protein HNQ94_001460 [Salirhabdus euzebyi]|uniref:Immunoglobulin-like domain of spore germination n=1 Tax=Salirhabdus euzebyi TaxID=394506 RepID=A0A841Q3R9_9BACI|nr:BsuPI-related putative proteinase inhibitor [Salirhabdus euzebyi]MBB6453012.1 hypothetical protein [Salirhabdus euzebyi]